MFTTALGTNNPLLVHLRSPKVVAKALVVAKVVHVAACARTTWLATTDRTMATTYN